MFINTRKKKHCRPRKNISEEYYKELFRFRKESVDFLAETFLEVTEERKGGSSLNQTKKIKIFLRYVSNPGFQRGVAEDVGVLHSTICKTFDFVLYKIVEKASQWIYFPKNLRDLDRWMQLQKSGELGLK